ncbi:hypothetical protein B0H14DRAFT_2567292 [Mycena olivaceomarginata]|nr:hypothetical protein B0H14DRAFT_2567292 [Mycena olivaceomarginata]
MPKTTSSNSDATLTDAQTLYLKSLESEFRAYILTESKGDKDLAQKAAKKWKDDNTSAIFETIKRQYPYPTAWARDTKDSKVKGYIRRYFGNILQGSLVRTQVIQPGVGEHQNNALFTAPRPVTARQLYAADERAGVLTLADNLKKKTGGNSAGCYQTALKTLWTTTDTNIKQKYEEQARQQGLNVDLSRNQREFEDNIGGTLQDLCTNGALGPAEMILLASFRNSAGELQRLLPEYTEGGGLYSARQGADLEEQGRSIHSVAEYVFGSEMRFA